MEVTRRGFLRTGTALAAAQSVSANDRIQIGVIGCGARSQQLMDALLVQPQARITGVVDAYKGRIERTLDHVKGSAKPFATYTDLLADKSIDAVVIATPDHWHRAMVIDALRAGKDVYCEKPLTYRASEGAEIAREAKERSRIVQVGSQGVSSPLQQKAREIIRSGRLGQITLIRAARNRNTPSGAWLYPIPPDASPSTVNWEMFLGPAPKRPFSLERFFRWRCFEDYSGGIATDLFVHLCTTIHYLMGAKMPSKAVALGQLYRWKENRDVPDTINGVLEYPEGFAVNLSATFNNQGGSEETFEFLGTEGTLKLANGLTFVPENGADDNGWIVDSWPKALADAYYRDPNNRETEMPGTRKPKALAAGESYREEGMESTVPHMGNFLAAVRSRQPFWEDAVAGHHAAACAHMVNQSAKQKRMMEWDFSKDDLRA